MGIAPPNFSCCFSRQDAFFKNYDKVGVFFLQYSCPCRRLRDKGKYSWLRIRTSSGEQHDFPQYRFTRESTTACCIFGNQPAVLVARLFWAHVARDDLVSPSAARASRASRLSPRTYTRSRPCSSKYPAARDLAFKLRLGPCLLSFILLSSLPPWLPHPAPSRTALSLLYSYSRCFPPLCFCAAVKDMVRVLQA